MTTTISGGTYITGDFLLSHDPRAYATATITGGVITAITVTSGGEGYTTAPAVTIIGDGTGATATSTITDGVVTGFTITNGGSGYSRASVSIAAPGPTALSAIVIPVNFNGGYGAPYTSGAIFSVNGGVGFDAADNANLPAAAGYDYGTVSVVDGVFYLNGVSSYVTYTSTDGNVWFGHGGAQPRNENRTKVAGNSTIVATLFHYTNNAATSTNQGATWTTRTLPDSLEWLGLAHGDGNFVGTSPSNIAVRSSDGINWSNVSIWPSSSISFYGIAYGNGTWVAISRTGNVVTSTDSSTWTPVANITNNNYRALAYGGGRFVAPHYNGLATSSDNGVTWTLTASPSGRNYREDIAYGNGAFWMVTYNNDLVTTTDGVTQTTVQSAILSTDYPFAGIAVS